MFRRPFNRTGIKNIFYVIYLISQWKSINCSRRKTLSDPSPGPVHGGFHQPEKIKRFLFFLSQSLSVRRKKLSNTASFQIKYRLTSNFGFFKDFSIDLTCSEQCVQWLKPRILEIVLQRNHQLNTLLRNSIRHSPDYRLYDIQSTQKSFLLLTFSDSP